MGQTLARTLLAQEDPLVAALHARHDRLSAAEYERTQRLVGAGLTCGVVRQTPQMTQDIEIGSIQRRTTRGRAWLAIAVATLTMIGIVYGEIWTLERGGSSMTACYVALSNDLAPLMSVDEMDIAASDPTCGP